VQRWIRIRIKSDADPRPQSLPFPPNIKNRLFLILQYNFFVYFFSGLKCVGHSFAYHVAYFCIIDSVADPGCLSRSPDPDFFPSRIPDPKTATKERGEKKLFVIPFYEATNFTKLKIILVLKCRRKKFGPIFKEL
jgi:hypothetical protein